MTQIRALNKSFHNQKALQGVDRDLPPFLLPPGKIQNLGFSGGVRFRDFRYSLILLRF
jgi:hypothetical protein